jgi:GNAT superfamily N-acetyltransferase
MKSDSYQIHTLNQRPDLIKQVKDINREAWPKFLLHNEIEYWHLMFGVFAAYQILLCDSQETLLGVGLNVPLIWDGTPDDLPAKIGAGLGRAADIYEKGFKANTILAIAIMVRKHHRNYGLGSVIIQANKTMAGEYGLDSLIVSLRPALKSHYPLTPMERYAQWRKDDGEPFDPWLRIHWRLGAEPLKITPNILTVTGSVAEWENWTRMSFPESGRYIVPGALEPVDIDCEKGMGWYEEPNIWLKYCLAPSGVFDEKLR